MSSSFGENVDPCAAIRAILGSYPFSVGLLRELLQNSDDARASKQVFILDHRTHTKEDLYNTRLTSTQGPALLAFNDAIFEEEDWSALQNIHRSSKKMDTSKIGKYGIGFRSVYHITDYPQILSGPFLAILDPQHNFAPSGGVKIDLSANTTEYQGHLATFDSLLPADWQRKDFTGSIIRLPLRNRESDISNKVVESHEISQLLHDFIKDEMNIALLFLENVKTIELYEINERGNKTQIATSTITRAPSSLVSQQYRTHTASITTTTQRGENTKVWRLLRCPFPQDDAISLLAGRTGFDPSHTLSDNKLLPNVSLAVPLTIADHTETSGRLFTFLPLPMKTGFPGHIHALFALTQSRQNLRNSEDTGIVRGSNDSILVEWNKVLFEDFIPKAWACLLEVLTNDDHLAEVFRAWPPSQPKATCGDSLAWRTFPTDVFQQIFSSNLAVWPVYGANVFRPLESVLVAPPEIKEEIVAALSSVGLEITRPPRYIVDIMNARGDSRLVILTPKVAHTALLKHVNRLESIPPANTTTILEYLLSTEDLDNIVKLPIVPLVGGRTVALISAHSSPSFRHTLLERLDYDLFSACDNDAIALADLPKPVAELFRKHGRSHLNVDHLKSDKVISYLDLHPNRLGLNLSTVQTDALAVKWLSAFWVWFNESSLKDELFPKLRNVFLLPCTSGLKKAERPVFQQVGEHPNLVQELMTLGVPFLHSTCAVPAQNVLTKHGLLKKIDNIHALLETLSSCSYGSLNLDETKARLLLDHIASRLPASCSSNGRLNEDLRKTLRSLPMFCLVNTDGLNVTAQWTHIPTGSTVRGIISSSSREILPRITQTVYIDLSNSPRQILSYLEPNQPNPMTDVQLLSLALEHLAQQPQPLQATILKHIINNRYSTPPYILQKLRQTPFVYTVDSTVHAPDNVIDPSSTLVALFPGSNDKLPRRSNTVEKQIVEGLASLGLLQSSLTGEIVKERVQYISQHLAPLVAKALIKAINNSSIDCRTVHFDSQIRWLPTNQGLLKSSECRPCSVSEDELNLFDQVLCVLEGGITVSASLRAALGWDQPIPLEILVKQLDQVITKNMPRKVFSIIRELSKRNLSGNDFNALRGVTSNRGWIPQSGRHDLLISTSDAVISEPIKKAGFYQISATLLDRKKVVEFLKTMGCSDKPSPNAILKKLDAFRGQPPTEQTALASISLLKALGPVDLDEDQRNRIFIPDVDFCLRPVANVYFNDIGERSILISAGADLFHAHPRIDESLCRDLKMGRLGLKFVHLQTPGHDMGEQLVTTVSRTLGQYTKKQLLPEFLANACDAKATVFSVLLNEFHGSPTKLLSSSMAKFYDCPSLLIYNDSTFSDKDFEGICRTSVGGKKGQSDSIGQFGLGALTMFHVTELAIIISGNDMLFLNPSREHLPIKDRAALKMPLSDIRKFYPGHLTALQGMFGCNAIETGSFQGTIFMLPLRKSSHHEGLHHVSRETWTVEKVREDIMGEFKRIAADCLLFTEIVTISASFRGRGGVKEDWSIKAARESPLLEGNFLCRKLTISHFPVTTRYNSHTWQIATQTVAIDCLPHGLLSVSKRPPIVGLAASLDPENKHELGRVAHRFFSILPLPTSTSLPVHVTASFVLSSDRRNIRFDEYDNLETKYNKWLLSTILPPLYLFLLAKLSNVGDNKRYWPGNTPVDDTISRTVTNTFYSTHLKSCKLPVFRSKFHPCSVHPEQAVMSGDEPKAVTTALELMKPLDTVKLPGPVRRRVIDDAGILAVSPQYLKTKILFDPNKLTSTLNEEEISEVVRFLVQDGVGAVVGLRILPLEDGTFGTFTMKSSGISYYVWKKSYGPLIFSPDRIVSSEFHPKDLKILDVDLNVVSLGSTSVSALVKERLPAGEEMFNATPPLPDWITSFWNAYPRLDMNVKDIDLLPLVATMQAGHFVSLSYCRSRPIVLSNENELAWLWDRLQQLGIITIQKGRLPRALTSILEGKDYPAFNLTKLLSAMEPCISQIVGRIQSLDKQSHEQFALWLRTKLSSKVPPNLIIVASRLPIWPAARMNQPSTLCAALEVRQLPSGLGLGAARFMKVLVSPEPNLKHLDVETISFSALHSNLELPRILDPSDEDSYKTLLRAWIGGMPASDTQPLRVPNCNRVMQPSNLLYARDPLFEAAFGPGSPSFILRRFQDLEVNLHKHGLQRQGNLNMTIFANCAHALHDSQDDGNKTARAAVVFASYSQDLPLRVGSAEQHLWHNVDDLRFIPRKMNVIRELQYVQHLPEVVSPNELVREEFESIAWTQKAFFDEQPDQRVLLAYPGLGRPSVSDVVAHLQILSTLRESETLLRDVTATYKWLNDNADAARDTIIQCHDQKIFLNVNDPSNDEWTWEAADNLAFGTHDVEEIQRVRSFLTPFRALLLSAGVVSVYQPSVADASPLTSDSALLLQIRTGFNEMRKAGQFIDVVFIPSSETESGESGLGVDLELVAHRNFLAVYSDYFRDAFCGTYKEALEASSNDPIRFPVDYPKSCITAVLDYIYSGTSLIADLPDEEGQSLSLDDLLDIMKLSEYWHLTGLFEIVQREIANKRLIDPTTLAQTRDVASSINAMLLLDYCREYESHNSDYIRKIYELQRRRGDVAIEEDMLFSPSTSDEVVRRTTDGELSNPGDFAIGQDIVFFPSTSDEVPRASSREFPGDFAIEDVLLFPSTADEVLQASEGELSYPALLFFFCTLLQSVHLLSLLPL